MTIKELKNNILLALYKRYKEGEMASVGFDKLCSSYSIIYDSKQQLSNAVKSLKSDNFVNAIFFTGDEGLIHNITPDGVLFVEENLLSDDDLVVDGLKDTDKRMKSRATIDVDIETDSEPVTNNVPKSDKSVSTAYNTKENYQEIVDSSVEPCFGVTTLAECYIKQLDKIAKHTNDNFCMLGIFGPWGRGKTYFFKKIKALIIERTNKKTRGKTSNNIEDNKQQIKYKIIEFNAWKYQDTPAIWAYLYETIYGEGLNWFEKVCFSIKSKLPFILFIVFYFLFIWLYPQLNDFSENVKSILLNLRWPISIITALFGVMYTIIKNPFSTYSKIEKHFKRKSYKGTLGIQNALEQDLESLIKSIVWRPKKKQIILYVDDIDRCAIAKMLNVVNSLRLILENAEIQKRMIVICSIDANKLIKAYCSSKFVGNDYNKEQLKEAKEHLDKLFIFGIGLSPIDQSQQIEYLRKLYGSDETQTTIQTPFIASREKHSLIAISGDEELVELTDRKLGEYIGKYLENNKIVELTPRKIRIIYYRLLFANNIMASGKALIKEETLDKIIKLSLNDDFSNFDIDTAGSDVVGMVVPY